MDVSLKSAECVFGEEGTQAHTQTHTRTSIGKQTQSKMTDTQTHAQEYKHIYVRSHRKGECGDEKRGREREADTIQCRIVFDLPQAAFQREDLQTVMASSSNIPRSVKVTRHTCTRGQAASSEYVLLITHTHPHCHVTMN